MEGCCHGQGPPSRKHVVKPERVLVYTKKMEVRWRALEADLQGVRSLDDVIRIDLDFLLRRALTHNASAASYDLLIVHR